MLTLKHPVFFLLTLIVSLNFSACSRPEVTPPSVEPVFSTYLKLLESGKLKDVDLLYFMPLHWRQKQKIYKHFQQQHDLIKQKKITLKVGLFKQKGRWAVAMLESTQSGKRQTNPLWLFYYDARWQLVSPLIFKTGPVRSMMDLYREQKELRTWYEREQLQAQNKKMQSRNSK